MEDEAGRSKEDDLKVVRSWILGAEHMEHIARIISVGTDDDQVLDDIAAQVGISRERAFMITKMPLGRLMPSQVAKMREHAAEIERQLARDR